MSFSLTNGAREHCVAICCAALIGMPFLRAYLGVPDYAYLIVILLLGLLGTFRVITADDWRAQKLLLIFCFCLMLFSVWLGLSSAWTVSHRQYMVDIQRLAGLSLLAIFLPCAGSRRSAQLLVTYIIICSIAASGVVFSAYFKAGSLRGYEVLFHEFYLVSATLIGMGSVLAFLNFVSQQNRKGLNAVISVFLLGGLALSLARGALISAVFVIIFFSGVILSWRYGGFGKLLFKMRLHKEQVAMIPIALGVSILTAALALNIERTYSRLYRLFSGGEFSESGRMELWARSIARLEESPIFGYGSGSSGIMAGAGEELYPHNFILQVALDGGIIGVFLLIGWVAVPFKALFTRGKRTFSYEWAVILGGYTFIILEYMKSSNFYTARSLVVLGVCAVLALSADHVPDYPEPNRNRRKGRSKL